MVIQVHQTTGLFCFGDSLLVMDDDYADLPLLERVPNPAAYDASAGLAHEQPDAALFEQMKADALHFYASEIAADVLSHGRRIDDQEEAAAIANASMAIADVTTRPFVQ